MLDTGRVPVAEQFSYWREVVSGSFVPLQVERDRSGPFAGSIEFSTVGPVGVAHIASQPQRVRRTPPLIAAGADEALFVNYQVRGTGGMRQDGQEGRLVPGDFTIVDSTRPFELSFGRDFAQLCFTLPRELIAPRLPVPRDATALRVRGDRGAGALAAQALRALAEQGPALDRAAARGAAEHVLGLVAVALRTAVQPPASASRAALLRAAMDEAGRRLDDPDLSPAGVAASIGVSTRHLHRLFADRETTFGRWLLGRRLEGARRELAEPAWDHLPIAAIAARWGFRDASYFGRAFRARYGLTPGAHRREP